MAFTPLKKWLGSKLWSAFMAEYNDNIDELNSIIPELQTNISLLGSLLGSLQIVDSGRGTSIPAKSISDGRILLLATTRKTSLHLITKDSTQSTIVNTIVSHNDVTATAGTASYGANFAGVNLDWVILQIR